MSVKYYISFFVFLTFCVKGQYVINDSGLRLSLSADKKINDRFSLNVKVASRQVENFRLLNRIYIRPGVDVTLNDHFKASFKASYIYSRKGFKEFSNNFRYALSLTYKTKLTDRLSLSNKLTYQNTATYFIRNIEIEQKDNGVIRDKTTLKLKHTRRGDVYLSEELLFQIVGKTERYFGRNRVYIGYIYKLNSKLDLDAYFILERTHGGTSAAPKERTFFYGLNLGYSF